ncbi:recombinase family protein [Sporosarcina ureae]|nr:recombinase family protein [Sporosarcina ureae]
MSCEERLSGKITGRPELHRMLLELRPDDVVHVHEISRLSRSVKIYLL